ncbi:hypothetical protein L0P88_15285 [Muricauda sp. SCSIO 64092]|uniref:hypothetical protein n=1 Tax=Allomuricauda sp. SCSIO 64092 TaxID=2908842 RepID=UPI001FF1275F|nr:hypothetical protein [Muricauda sp. SCSIO 64092]UOY05308.1 hypothetical protein L0P88_15285 [Muricauda sp. SCSIO 64092]
MPIFNSLTNSVKAKLDTIGYYTYDFYIFVFLSILMLLISGIFNIPGIAEHPQFEPYLNSTLIADILKKDEGLSYAYHLFFIVDFFWAFYLLLVLAKYMYRRYRENGLSYPKELIIIFLTFALLAFAFDCAENTIYLIEKSFVTWIVTAKKLFYGLVFVIALLSFIDQCVNRKKYLSLLKKFLKSAFYSLLVLLVIGVLLPTATQVNSIVVDLYLVPFNLLLLLTFAPFFAIVVAHYPSYFNQEKGFRTWYMAKYRIANLIGIVYYRNNTDRTNPDSTSVISKINFLLRILGICFYISLFYMVSYTSQVNFDWNLKMGPLSLCLLIVSIFLLHFLKEVKQYWYQMNYEFLKEKVVDLYDGDYSPNLAVSSLSKRSWFKKLFRGCEAKNTVKEDDRDSTSDSKPDPSSKPSDFCSERYNCLKTINIPVKVYLVLFLFTIASHFLLGYILLFCENLQYGEWTVRLSLLCIVGQLFTYIFYRSFRSVLRIVLFNEYSTSIINSFLKGPERKLNDGSKDAEGELMVQELDCEEKDKDNYYCKRLAVIKCFKTYNLAANSRLLRFFAGLRFGAFSNNITFLQINAFYGIINFIFLLIINFDSSLALSFSTIIIILAVLFFVYGVLVVFNKNWIYHNYRKNVAATTIGSSVTSKSDQKRFRTFQYLSTSVFILLLALYGITKSAGNDLFTLQPVKRDLDNELVFADFMENLDSLETRYYIGCYGGGMKSNAWTMTVLNELSSNDERFFEKTVGISGVSGGTMGMINFFSIWDKYPNADQKTARQRLIDSVATENILSMDMTHALGRDLLTYLFYPADASGTDRSNKVMEHYARLTKDGYKCDPNRTNFRSYWKYFYDSSNSNFPIFIANTTNIKGNQGMAASIGFDTTNTMLRKELYKGADDILEITRNDLCGSTDKYTLDYYKASSTSNRFPLLSPAAKIETKGHYNDGGIFENSGLYSVYKLFQTVNRCEGIADLAHLKQKNVFLCIINDKNLYIKHILGKDSLVTQEINYNSELGAIINSVASTEMTPRAIKTQLEILNERYPHRIKYLPIYLPHRFTVADVKALCGKKISLKDGSDADEYLLDVVNRNNKEIERIYGANNGEPPIIEPPMSRVMAKPAYEFMKSMIAHEVPKKVLENVKELH